MQKDFEIEYKRLNKAQKQAVDTIEGPVMVVAGPGTGKTQILALRIANILKSTDTEPENILALTFTESGVSSMRKRLSSMIGSAAYSVVINTFHGFSNDIIKNNPEDFPYIIGSRSITNVEQIGILEEIIINTKLEILKPFGDTFYYVRAILSAINNLKREGVGVEEFENIAANAKIDFEKIEDLYYDKGAHEGKMKGKYKDQEKIINKNTELADVYKQYQEALQKQKLYDFSDMIMETLRALKENEDLLLRMQEEYQYILVDEHQDTNNAQNKILELLANFHDNPNLFVVGDEKQSIFRFQGASLENFFYFKYLYPGAKLVTLEENYRSTQKILDASHSLIAGEKELRANAPHTDENIHFMEFQGDDSENYFIASEIQKKIKEGVTPGEIAVLYRNNADAFPVADMLGRLGLSYVIESDQDIFSNKYIKKMIKILRAVHEPLEDEYVAEVLHLDLFKLNSLDTLKLIRSAYQKRKFNLVDILKNKNKILDDLKLETPEKFTDLGKKILGWVKVNKNDGLLDVAEDVLRESEILVSVMADPNATEELEVLNKFFDEIRQISSTKAHANLIDLFNYLSTVENHKLSIKSKVGSKTKDKVRLMTAHKSKGLEFEYVYIVNAYDGHWGNKRRRELLPLLPAVYRLFEDKDKTVVEDMVGGVNDDERRLFYVALTRAKKHVYISYGVFGSDGRERAPSQFIAELREDLVDIINLEDHESEFKKNQDIVYKKDALEVTDEEYKERYKEFVREKFTSQGLSVSALNNYLKSPWQYFYRNLVRIPEKRNKYQTYGIAVHAALQDFFENAKAVEDPGIAFLLASFESHLKKQDISVVELEDLLQKGQVSLETWYENYKGSWNFNTLNEFMLNGVYVRDDIRLTGVLDKVEMVDESDKIVDVTDYKTGKPKTANFIKGETKTSDGGYFRQLVFYKLLLSLYKNGRYVMRNGTIDFVEPDTKGKLVKHTFEIMDEDVDDLRFEIERVANEILNLDFWDEPCDPDVCDYCDLVEELKR